MDYRHKYESETIKLLEENTGLNLQNLGFADDF